MEIQRNILILFQILILNLPQLLKNHDVKCTEFTPMQNANFKNNMEYISANLCFSTRAIEHSETKNVSSTEILRVVEKYADKLENTRRHEKSCFMICYCN